MVPVTALYAGILALIILALAYNVSLTRRREKIGLGDENNRNMLIAMRIHCNATEILPIAIILMLLYELNGGAALVLHLVGTGLILGRIMHFYGLQQQTGRSFGRYWGTAISWLSVAGLAAAGVTNFVLG